MCDKPIQGRDMKYTPITRELESIITNELMVTLDAIDNLILTLETSCRNEEKAVETIPQLLNAYLTKANIMEKLLRI